MKKTTLALGILLLGMCLTAFKCGGPGGSCDPPDCYETIECDATGHCVRVRHHRFFVDPGFQASANNVSEYVGILDLANAWQPKQDEPAQITIKFQNASGQTVQKVFALSPAPAAVAAAIHRVDKDTTPYAFVVSEPESLSDFLNSATASGYSDSNATETFSFNITQVDCTADSGKYVNHLRTKDSSGITYDESFYITYTAPADGQGGCNRGSISSP